MEPKKISFGFKKTSAKPNKIVVEEKKEFIECVEEKAIRIVGGEEVQENLPIVIPAQPNTLRNADSLKRIAEAVEKGIEEVDTEKKPEIKTEIPENETLEQMAVRELLENAKKEVKLEKSDLKLVVPENKIPEGAKESTLDDYENIPVGEFGLAMLRGMGWDASQEKSKYKLPDLRPKGLGLGADKVVKDNQKKSLKKDNEELAISKNGFVKVVTGKYSNYYGQIVSLDEDNGRVMINIPMKKETVSLSEFMVQPVTKSEYDRESKVINKDSYDAYKKNELNQNRGTETSKDNSSSPSEGTSNKKTTSYKDDRNKHNDDKTEDKDRQQNRDSDSKKYEGERDKARRREKDRDSSSPERRRKDSSSSPERSKKSKHRKRRDKSSGSETSDSDRKYKSKKNNMKRDIDKKRKGKKKKRDRDRSPSYRKHRK